MALYGGAVNPLCGTWREWRQYYAAVKNVVNSGCVFFANRLGAKRVRSI
jgi:hypothetical protein